MDIKIENGDISVSPSGIPNMIDGFALAEQQVNLALKIPKHSFIYNREAGAFSGSFDFEADNAEKKIESLINECLLHTEIYADVAYTARSGENILIGINLNNGFETKSIEVKVNGQL